MLTALTNPGLTQALYAVNVAMAHQRPNPLRLPPAVLTALRAYALARPSRVLGGGADSRRDDDVSLDVTALVVLGVANCSQALLNFALGRLNDPWILGKGFDRITVLDTLFTVLDWAAAVARIVAVY